MKGAMEAVDFAEILTASGLEGPSGAEALFACQTFAEVFALGASTADLDPRAAAGIEFLLERIRTSFTAPALATTSREALLELWSERSWSVLRLMDAIVVCLYEASQAHSSALIERRLEHGDRSAITGLSVEFEQRSEQEVGERLRDALSSVEAARRLIKQRAGEFTELQVAKLFHRGILIWLLGVHLCAEAAERLSSLVEDPLRSDFARDAVEIALDGSRMAAVAAMLIAGLRLPSAPTTEFRQAWASHGFTSFMLRATEEIPRVFGRDVRFQLDFFRYPDEPDAWELHVIIDTSAPAADACELLDKLCDEWWDEATVGFGFGVHPVLGAVGRG
jgi:hypothetical protein